MTINLSQEQKEYIITEVCGWAKAHLADLGEEIPWATLLYRGKVKLSTRKNNLGTIVSLIFTSDDYVAYRVDIAKSSAEVEHLGPKLLQYIIAHSLIEALKIKSE